jgi:hypothetical protein
MLLQLLLTSASANVPVPSLNKPVRARVVQIYLEDNLGGSAQRVYRITSPSIQNMVSGYNNAILFPRREAHPVIDFGGEGPEVIIDCKGNIRLDIDTVQGGAAGTVSACLLTVDVLGEVLV